MRILFNNVPPNAVILTLNEGYFWLCCNSDLSLKTKIVLLILAYFGSKIKQPEGCFLYLCMKRQ